MIALFGSALEHKSLIRDLVIRDISARYKGTLLGMVWALLNPLLMLGLYTFFFTLILKSKWGGGDTQANYGLMLFSGLIVHGWMAEVLSRSPDLLSSNRNYVKKVVFPLDTLVWITVLSSLFQVFLSLVLLCLLALLMGNGLSWTLFLLQLVLLPLFALLLGLGWFVASLAVYFRDVGQFMGSFLTLLLFTSTAFFSLETAPEVIRSFLLFNPLTIIMDSLRDVQILHRQPDWSLLSVHAAVSFSVMWFGYRWFSKTKAGFADVL
ncbi:ABC transporter permease [Aeromonas salmonicida]|uniref:ABC transporter permease n=1 Tax=Aeromonas salmonicida TaxID=645 RepID=UPI0038D20192